MTTPYTNTNTVDASTGRPSQEAHNFGQGPAQGDFQHQGGELRAMEGGAPDYSSTSAIGGGHHSHSGEGAFSAPSDRGAVDAVFSSHTAGGYDPVSHQASEIGRHPVAAASHPAHPVVGAENQERGGLRGFDGAGGAVPVQQGAYGATSSNADSTGKDIAKHPIAAASHPSHPGLAASVEDSRKGGHLTDAAARRDPSAPTSVDASSSHPSHSHHDHGDHDKKDKIKPGEPIHGVHEGAHKPTMGEKISGTVEALVGKVTGKPEKVEEGNIKKTEGKEAAARAHLTDPTHGKGV